MTDDINHSMSETPSDMSDRSEVERTETPTSETAKVSSKDNSSEDMGVQNVMDYDQSIPTFS